MLECVQLTNIRRKLAWCVSTETKLETQKEE